MFLAQDGTSCEVATKKRYFRVKRNRQERLLLRDKAIADLVESLGWRVHDVADAFSLHRDTVYDSLASFRQLVREIANRC
jgi:hypothetical protein